MHSIIFPLENRRVRCDMEQKCSRDVWELYIMDKNCLYSIKILAAYHNKISVSTVTPTVQKHAGTIGTIDWLLYIAPGVNECASVHP